MSTSALIQLFLSTVQLLLSQITNAKIVNNIITALIQIIPVAIQEAKDVLPAIQNIIAALSANPATTAQQLATLQALDKQVDDAFEQAVADYLAAKNAGAAQ